MIDKKVNIEFSISAIVKMLIVLFAIWILYLIRDVLAILFFSVLLVSILEPAINWLQIKKIPKSLSVIFIYLLLLAVVVFIVVLLIPPITDQVNQLSNSFPQYWELIKNDFVNLNRFLSQAGISQAIESSLQTLKAELPETTSNIFSHISDFFSSLISLFVVLVITFYVLVEENAIKRILHSVIPSDFLPYAYQLVNRMQKKLGLWLRGQLILCLIIFLLVYFGLLLLGVKYALILAIIAGLLEFIPYLGPFLAGFIAVTLTLFQSPITALLVVFLYMAIQSVENHILVPKVMQKTVGLNPVISIIALLVGAKLGNIVGVILAIPVATVLSVFIEDVISQRRETEMKLEE